MGTHPANEVQARQARCRMIGCKTTRQPSFYTGRVSSVNTAQVLIVSLLARFATVKLCNEALQAQRCRFGSELAYKHGQIFSAVRYRTQEKDTTRCRFHAGS